MFINSVSSWGELGDSLGAFRDGVSGEFTGKEELNGSLDLSGAEGSSLVESNELGRFEGDSLEGIVNEGVHDVHGLLGDTNIRVDLLQDLEDIDSEGLWSSLLIFADTSCSSCSLDLLFSDSGSFLRGSHFGLDIFGCICFVNNRLR